MKKAAAAGILALAAAFAGSGAGAQSVEVRHYLNECRVQAYMLLMDKGTESPALLNGKDCRNVGMSPSTEIVRSHIKVTGPGINDFRVTVVDKTGAEYNDRPPNQIKPLPISPEQQAKARADAIRFAAQNIFRECMAKLENLTLNPGGLPASLNGKTCAEFGLNVPNVPGVTSLIRIYPGTIPGYQVTVHSPEGQVLRYPDRDIGWWEQVRGRFPLNFALARQFLASLLLLLLPTFLPARRWVGVWGLVLSGVGASMTALVLLSQADSNDGLSYLPFLLMVWAFFFHALPRLVWQWRREAWWVSLGAGSLYGMVQLVLGGFAALLWLENGESWWVMWLVMLAWTALGLLTHRKRQQKAGQSLTT